MSKILKRFLLILIILIGAMLAIPKLEQAIVNASDSTVIYGVDTSRVNAWTAPTSKTLGELKKGEELYGVEDWILNNRNVFCIQRQQQIKGRGYWKITRSITIDSNSNKWAKGLAYILNEATIGMSDVYQDYENDDVQIAVWNYLCKTGGYKEAREFFGGINITNNGDEKDYNNVNDNVKILVETAMNICTGKKARCHRRKNSHNAEGR